MSALRRSKKPATEAADPGNESEWVEWCRLWKFDHRDPLVRQMADWHLSNGVVRVNWGSTMRNWREQDKKFKARDNNDEVDVQPALPAKPVEAPKTAVAPPKDLFGDLFDIVTKKEEID